MSDSNPSISVRSIKFKDRDDEVDFNPDDIVLLVGANNVGKSRILKDLQEDIINNGSSKVIVDSIQYVTTDFTAENTHSYFERNIPKDDFGNYCVTTNANCTYCYGSQEFGENFHNNKTQFYKAFYSLLSTESRLNITRSIRSNQEVNREAYSIIRKLGKRPEAIAALNRVLTAAFDKSVDVYTDYGESATVTEFRIGNSQEVSDALNLCKSDWLKKVDNLERLQNQGDGIRGAVGILSSLIVEEHTLFLIDEPEAFLHPPQAKIIGKSIVEMSRGKQCFIATHNIDFIKGVIESDSSRVKIIKVNRAGNKNTFDLVDNQSIAEIAADKNLKYTNILDGLFYGKVLLCEDESDCKFYAAMLENTDISKYQDTLFCAVGGKDQLKKVIPLLKRLHIQYLAIADIDLLNSKSSLRQLLDAIEPGSYKCISDIHQSFLDAFEKESYKKVKTQEVIIAEITSNFADDLYLSNDAAKRIREILKSASNLELLKKGGKSVLPQGDCVKWFDKINEQLKRNGVHIVECGEIERFVTDVDGHGNNWLKRVFETHPDLENDTAYEDAKAFVRKVFSESEQL